MQLKTDWGLQSRMLLTMVLLAVVYCALIAVLVTSGISFALIIIIMALVFGGQMFCSDKVALRALGAREVSAAEAPELHAIINTLCIQADLPMPRVAIADTQVPNACAMGRSPKSATVCATRGILNLLEAHELEAVIAHELSHIRHRDAMIMTIASFFASIAALITRWGAFFGGRRNQSFIFIFLVSLITYAVSWILMMALSRYREFAADRGSALLTGRPSALASALLRLEAGVQRIPDRDLRKVGSMNAFFIMPTSVKDSLHTLLSTHPSTAQRIARLEAIEVDMQARPQHH